ncbi:MAG: DNA (cytosine-5-)-methyltransferase [Mycoplasmoidaceae bacterium]
MNKNNNQKIIKVFEAFAGIGAQRKALENIAKEFNYQIQSVGQIEWYSNAIIGYFAIHHDLNNIKIEKLEDHYFISRDSKKIASDYYYKKIDVSLTASYLNHSKSMCHNFFDITKTKGINIPKNIDIFTYSFPCQDLSIQGKQLGMKNKKTKSGLLWEIDRILSEMKKIYKEKELPKYLILENVSNITSKRHIEQYHKWIKKLMRLGYESKTYHLNSKNFGSCQNRSRVFCISIRKDFKNKVHFEFPDFSQIYKKPRAIKSILEKDVDEKYYKDNLLKYDLSIKRKTKTGIIKSELIGYTKFKSEAYIYDPNGVGPTLTASGANSRIKIITKDQRIRTLTPLECLKYMGFTKQDYLRLKKTNLLSDNNIIYLAGNSIPVQLLEVLFRSLKF